jgi:putative ABC transport system permease protein
LLEAVLLTGVGGLLGVFLGTAFAFLVSLVITNYVGLEWTFSFPLSAAVLGIVVSTLVGLIFGIYPARKASQKSPIESLRYE